MSIIEEARAARQESLVAAVASTLGIDRDRIEIVADAIIATVMVEREPFVFDATTPPAIAMLGFCPKCHKEVASIRISDLAMVGQMLESFIPCYAHQFSLPCAPNWKTGPARDS